jgi:2-polyprenyl-3-methyl-5-hydroxy-6-metoxy-1,4-benzoquinol methylase
MNCYYCDKIRGSDPGYVGAPAGFDLGSGAPRCARHWRYVCGACGRPAHFMALSFCPEAEAFFCSGCATEKSEVESSFWAWKYYFRYRSPWSGRWAAALDRLEYEGRHPLQVEATRARAQAALSGEEFLIRYPERLSQWHAGHAFTDDEIQANWNTNADRWDAGYDDDGDRNRRYQSDEPMLALLGDVEGQRVLDVGCGNGYLCRKLARQGAIVTGVDLADRFLEIARERESQERLGITYHHASVAEMDLLPGSHFHKAVSNYVLMDVRDYEGALRHVYRVLRPGGRFVVVISHPCFSCGPAGWVIPALDSPRKEDRFGFRVDAYFQPGPIFAQWGDLDPVMGYHRPLRDYWGAFAKVGFRVDGFEEPSITERGLRELPVYEVDHAQRIPYSCIFRLSKPRGAEE